MGECDSHCNKVQHFMCSVIVEKQYISTTPIYHMNLGQGCWKVADQLVSNPSASDFCTSVKWRLKTCSSAAQHKNQSSSKENDVPISSTLLELLHPLTWFYPSVTGLVSCFNVTLPTRRWAFSDLTVTIFIQMWGYFFLRFCAESFTNRIAWTVNELFMMHHIQHTHFRMLQRADTAHLKF